MSSRPVTLSKNWQFNVNQKQRTQGLALTDWRQLMLAIVNSMLGFASNPWTCVGSSDSVSSGLAGTNLWAASTNLVFATTNGTAHSWIVLKNTNGLGTFQLLISLLGSTAGFQARIAFSPGGNYTGGSNTTDPTATDEVVALAGSWTDSTYATSVVGWISLHAEMSADGQCTRIWHHTSQGLVNGVLFIETLINAPAATVAVLAIAASTQALTFSSLFSSFNWVFRVSGVNGTGRLLTVGDVSAVLPNDSGNALNFTSDIDDAWPVCAAALTSSTVGVRGVIGAFQDMHVMTTQLRVGQVPNAAKTVVNLQPLVVPWNSTEMLVGG